MLTGTHDAVGQQLGYGDSIPQQQLDAARNIQPNTAALPQMARGMNALSVRVRVTCRPAAATDWAPAVDNRGRRRSGRSR